jgi:hypothetical protein
MLRVDANMHLQITDLKPGTTPAAQFLRLRNLRKSEYLAVEPQALGFEILRDGDLDVVNPANQERHTSSPRPSLRLPVRLSGC